MTDVVAVSCPVGGRSPRYDPFLLGGGAVVPYVGAWSGESPLPTTVIRRAVGGIGYADETLLDRDRRGVLWTRMAGRIGAGRPLFTKLHPSRQRRAMRHMLCQICARPADHNDHGTLWVLPGRTITGPVDGTRNVATTQPPLCRECARISVQICPALRTGHVMLRAHSRVCGVIGAVYRPVSQFGLVADDYDDIVSFEDPLIAWTQAVHPARDLIDITTITTLDLEGSA